MRDAILLFLLSLVTVGGVLAGKAARDVVLVTRFSAGQLAVIELLTAVAVLLVYLAQTRLLPRVPVERVLLLTPCVFVAGDLLLGWAATRSTGPGFVVAVCIWFGVQAPFSMTLVSLAAHAASRERGAGSASRMAAAGASLGWLAGGLVMVVTAGRFGVLTLIAAGAVLAALSPLVARTFLPAGSARHRRPVQARAPATHAPARWRVRDFRWTACLVLASSVGSAIAGYQLKVTAGESFESSAQLVRFFGAFNACAALASLCLQSGAPRLFRGWHPCSGLIVTPAMTAAAAMAFLHTGCLAAAVLNRGCEHAFRSSFERMAFDSRYRPFARSEVCGARTFIDAVVLKAGETLGLLAIVLCTLILDLRPSVLGVLNVAAMLAAAAAARAVRTEYAAGLRRRARAVARAVARARQAYESAPFVVDAYRTRYITAHKEPVMRINERYVNGAVVLDIVGSIRHSTVIALMKAVSDQIDDGRDLVVLNMERVKAVDSTGLGALLEAKSQMRRAGGGLCLAALVRLSDLTVITRLLTAFEVFDTVEDAVSLQRLMTLEPAHEPGSAGFALTRTQ